MLFVDDILKFDHSNERQQAVLYCVSVFMLYKVLQSFKSVVESLSATIQMKATEQYFPVFAVYHAVQDGSNY